MPIRIEEGPRWAEFRDTGWTFGDRRRAFEAASDEEALRIILPYVTGWSLPVVVSTELASLDDVDDTDVTFVVRAWFQARLKRNAPPKAN